jgi:ATP-dependent Lhr-like helicase
MVRLQFTNRKPLGAVEEAFVARLGKGDVFHFGGHTLEFVMMREGTAYVRRAPRGSTRSAATWAGSGLPYSQTLSGYVRSELGRRADGGTGAGADARGASAARGAPAAPGAAGDGAGSYAAALLAEQARVSALPGAGETLLEVLSTAEAEHLFLYPFEGTRLHEALGALISYRISRDAPVTLTVTANDYGIELRSPEPPAGGLTARLAATGALFDTGGLASDLEAAVNLSELARRRFRGIAQIAGLVFPGYPGNPRPRRELQASATLFYEVFRNHDPGHILLEQARREVLEEELLRGRLVSVLSRLGSSGLIVRPLERPGPLAFPLMVKELAARVSTESLAARVERMKRRWLAEAG